jgi:succinyl-diaminopimelate desuccinylase
MPERKEIFDFIDDSEVIQVTSDLVRIPTITHHEGRGIVDYYQKWFADLHIPVRLYPYENDRFNFFADYGAVSGLERFLFNGHQDTKPTGTMTVEPFGAEIRDGRMYGRGACDMKGGLAAILCAFKAMVRAGRKPRGGITFVSDIEEEYGGQGGICLLLDKGLLDGYAGLVSAEPSGLEINIGNKGGLATAFETKGKSAHSGLAYMGINAIHNMALFIQEFLKLPYLQVESPLFGKCTVNFEKIEGGLYLAAVPDRCLACLDSRLIPETPPELVMEQINGLMEKLNSEQGISISETDSPKTWREYKGGSPAAFIPPEHEFVLRSKRAFERATGEIPVLSGCPGATLAGALILKGTPSIICGPGALAQAHTDDEWVEIQQIPKAARIYAALMEEM